MKPLPQNHEAFVRLVQQDIRAREDRNKVFYEKRAHELGITDKNLVKELTELAITREARTTARDENFSTYEKFSLLVRLYRNQVNLSHRTSQSVLLQQYSTPAPISFLAGMFAGAYSSVSVFEPCAGNGLLTIAAKPEFTVVNEIDPVRRRHLESQGYKQVLAQDAGLPFEGFQRKFESVLTNPPFGRLDAPIHFGTFGIKTLEHMMVIHALNCMQDRGRAAVIVGGHATYDEEGRIRKGPNRIFLNYLYHHYQVEDVINISGKKLYSRQGTAFDTRLILIDGRKKMPEGHAPLYNVDRETPVEDFEILYQHIYAAHKRTLKTYEMTSDEYVQLRKKIDSLAPPRHNDWSSRIAHYEKEHREQIEKYAAQGYTIDERVRKSLPDLPIQHNQISTSMNSDDEVERLARELMRGLDEEGSTLGGMKSLKPFRIVIRQTSFPFRKYSLIDYQPSKREAKRFAELLVLDMQLRWEPAIKAEVESVEPAAADELGAPYIPTSDACIKLDTVVPDSMSFETHDALKRVKEAVGGDIDDFVRNRLGYPSKIDLCKALAAEQIDAVALAIYNIEARQLGDAGDQGQGMIIGDQTGIGKGRVAAAMIRYGVKQGYRPVFLTEKPNLFSDIYRDLKAIGSPHLVPFIINAKDAKSNVLDEYGERIYAALTPEEQNVIFDSGSLPSAYDFVMATYTQFNSPNKPKKRNFLYNLVAGNIMILDEAHNASGAGNTGMFIQEVVARSKGVLFLSATFAKRPDNMPLYAMKTVLRESNMDKGELVLAIRKGGVALQEVIASELVKEGQMLRRERSFEGVEVNYITLDEMEDEHRAIADSVTGIIREIIGFQKEHITKKVKALDKELAKSQEQAQLREGTQRAGADNMPYFSKVFQVINQMLFAIKAEAVADRAIQRLKEGKKPVIAFSSTMGSFIEQMDNIEGGSVKEGDLINADFSEVLSRGLKGITRYSVVDIDGRHDQREFDVDEMDASAQLQYHAIADEIAKVSTGITISPIDVIVQKIRKAGYTVAEVTGRKYELELFTDVSLGDFQHAPTLPGRVDSVQARSNSRRQLLGRVKARKRIVTNEAFRKFNNNEIDVLLINQAGSTGASAHAIPTDKVPPADVKQRVMIVLQAELDISTEVQKRGRINRTGQLHKPIYDYVTSAIPAEQRLMMMLQSKLKSLDANTTSNQKQSKKILDVPDFLNKYGDAVVREYIEDNPEINELLDEPLEAEHHAIPDAALKVSGRVAVLSTQMQQEFYEDVSQRYHDYVAYLKQTGEYDLEVEKLELRATSKSEEVLIMGKGGASAFGTDSVLEEVEVDVLRKPMRMEEIDTMIRQALSGLKPKELQQDTLHEYQTYDTNRHETAIREIETHFSEILNKLPEEKWLLKVRDTSGDEEYQRQLDEEKTKYLQLRDDKLQKLILKHTELDTYIRRLFEFFYVGRPVAFVQRHDEDGRNTEVHPAIFLGFVIDTRKKNPYALSNIKLRFAIAGSLRYVVLPASNKVDVMAIRGESLDVPEKPLDALPAYWQNATASSLRDRETRYIITGNILQALGKYESGRLISFSTSSGEERKGIFMPESWEPGEEGKERHITVPASKALPIIRSLGEGHEITIGKDISIFRQRGRFRLMVPASRSTGGEVYLNPGLMALMDGGNFNKVSSTMVGLFDEDVLEEVLGILEREIGTSVTVTRTQFEYIKQHFPQVLKVDNFPPMELLPEVTEESTTDEELELEAQALMLIQALELETLQLELNQ